MNHFIKVLVACITLIYSASVYAEINNIISEKQDSINVYYRGYDKEFFVGVPINKDSIEEFIACYKLSREQYKQIVALFPKEITLCQNT